MNREQRRKSEREEKKQRRAMWPNGICDVPSELSTILKDSEEFTIAGLKRMADGTFTVNCKPGTETVFTARVKK
jgi:hypothetical protein